MDHAECLQQLETIFEVICPIAQYLGIGQLSEEEENWNVEKVVIRQKKSEIVT